MKFIAKLAKYYLTKFIFYDSIKNQAKKSKNIFLLNRSENAMTTLRIRIIEGMLSSDDSSIIQKVEVQACSQSIHCCEFLFNLI